MHYTISVNVYSLARSAIYLPNKFYISILFEYLCSRKNVNIPTTHFNGTFWCRCILIHREP